MNLRISKKGLGRAFFAVFSVIAFISLPLQEVYAGPPQHVRYETAHELNLPPWRKLIVSWVTGNISNNWGYIRLLPSPSILKDLPLFMISGLDRQILWRLESFDVFDGEGWGQSDLSFVSVALNLSLAEGYNHTFLVHINRTASGYFVGVIPLPTSNETISGIKLEVEGDVVGYLTSFGSLVVSGNISTAGLTYQVAYSPPSYNLTKLAEARREDIPEEILSKYTVLPADISWELDNLIDSLRDDNLTIMGQLDLILDYFSQFKFNPNLSAQNVTGDPIAWFLENKEGDSSLFATAFILVSRGVGIPSRFVVGFKPKDVSIGGYWVRTSDIYSWAEVYFPGVGWVPVDPIPDQVRTEDALTSEVLSNLTIPFVGREKEQPESNQTAAITTNETAGEHGTVTEGNETLPQFTNESQTSTIKALFTNELFLLMLIGVAASIAIPVAYLSGKKGKTLEKEVVERSSEQEESLRILEELEEIYLRVLDFYDSAQYREGIIFLGDKFQELTASLLDFPKQEWETYREFILRFIGNNNLEEGERTRLVSFSNLLERAKYSQLNLSREDFLKGVELFSALLELVCSSLEAREISEEAI